MPFVNFPLEMISPGTGKSGPYPANQRKGLASGRGWLEHVVVHLSVEQTQSLGCSAECSGY